MDNPNYLPEEILFEIFSRLPTKSVGRCRCLSKSWRRNLSTPQFVHLHLTRSKPDQKDLLSVSRDFCVYMARIPVDENDTVVSRKLDLPDIYGKIVGTCNGLVLLLFWCGDLFSVMNPLTMQEVLIPNPSNLAIPVPVRVSYGFGYDKSSHDYKIVKLYNKASIANAQSVTFVDVYSMKNRVWKQLTNSPFEDVCGVDCDGAFLNGAIHWLAEVRNSGYVIAAFDLASESFRGIPAPNVKLDESGSYCVFATGGCLFLVGEDGYQTRDVWFMKQYGLVSSWTNILLSGIQLDLWGNVKPLCFISENQVLFLNDLGSLIVGNLTEGTTKNVAVDVDNVQTGYTLVATLVSPRQLHF